jgi:hypothetical protein
LQRPRTPFKRHRRRPKPYAFCRSPRLQAAPLLPPLFNPKPARLNRPCRLPRDSAPPFSLSQAGAALEHFAAARREAADGLLDLMAREKAAAAAAGRAATAARSGAGGGSAGGVGRGGGRAPVHSALPSRGGRAPSGVPPAAVDQGASTFVRHASYAVPRTLPRMEPSRQQPLESTRRCTHALPRGPSQVARARGGQGGRAGRRAAARGGRACRACGAAAGAAPRGG